LAFLEMITVGKLYSSKNGYTVDPNGELVAGGLANVIGSFFYVFQSLEVLEDLLSLLVQEQKPRSQVS